MKKKTFVVDIIVIILCLTMTSMIGCGRKKDKGLDESANTIAEDASDSANESNEASSEDYDEIIEAEDEMTDDAITKDEVRNIRPSIVSVNRFAEDELNRFDVGYISIDYVEIDEYSARLCPKLSDSLNDFNDKRKQELGKRELRFKEAANKYAEHIYEVTHSENAEMDIDTPEVCVNYEFIDVIRADNVAMSMLVTYTDFWGTDTLNTKYEGYTYDSQTGSRLDIAEVVTDASAYKNAVIKEYERKYGKVQISDIDPIDYSGWVLSPEGIIIYYPEGLVNAQELRDRSVQINFDEYPDVFNEKYCVASDEYTIPMNGDDIFYMDTDGDKNREAVVYSPLHSEEYTMGGEYPSYEIYVNGKCYSNFEEEWFYGYKPYYVHKKDGNYIYTYTEGYGQDYITVNKFEGEEPICIAKLPATPFLVENIDDPDEEFINRHIAFTNPSIIRDALSFDQNVCGTYKGDEGPGWEERFWDICNIDGRYYLDYIGEYDYSGAEIELLDEYPYLCGDELRYMVRVYPYSDFAFGGEYQGAGQVMYIASKVDVPGKRIELSSDNPFFYDVQTMYGIERHMHEVQDECKKNNVAPEIVGSWRSVIKNNSKEYEVYLQFDEDGRVDIVCKSENYTPMVYRGVYTLEEVNGKFAGNIEAEAIGRGRQPIADWKLEYDPSSDSPIKIFGEYEGENPLVYDVKDMKFNKTESGKQDKCIHPGPFMRTNEVAEMWDEYIYSEDYSFDYDFSPEYVDAIVDRAVELAGGTSYMTYGIQDNKNGGEMWIQVLDDIMPSVQVPKNWVRYDMGKLSYYDIHDNSLDDDIY